MQTLWVDRMIGKQPTIPDVVLELQELVQPTDLHCYEELTEEPAEEEQCLTPYKIIVACKCGTRLRLYVFATDLGIRAQQELLLGEVQLVCPECREKLRRHE